MDIKKNVAMKNHTSFKIGGLADEFCEAKSVEEIKELAEYAKGKNIPYYVIGNGTNLLVSDKGIRGLVIKIAGSFSRYTVDGDKIISESGALLSVLASAAQKNSLSGMEFASGIPGTLGGAIQRFADVLQTELEINDGTV